MIKAPLELTDDPETIPSEKSLAINYSREIEILYPEEPNDQNQARLTNFNKNLLEIDFLKKF